MISSFRNFAKTKFAGLLVFIMIIPFVFWGMGSMFSSGNTNNIAKINKINISTQEFIDHINNSNIPQQTIRENLDKNIIEELLSTLVSTTLLDLEVKDFDLIISENTLLKKIKTNKNFLNESGKFERIKYEKFLLENNQSAPAFELRLRGRELQKNLFDYIGAGTVVPEFLVNKIFEEENKKIEIEFINLQNFYKKKDNISDLDIKKFVDENKENLKVEYIDFDYAIINPKNLIGVEEFNQTFFDKIDQIEIDISNNLDFKEILSNTDIKTINKTNFRYSDNKSDIEKKIFEVRNIEFDIIENQNDYILYKINKSEERTPDLNDPELKNEVLELVHQKEKFDFNSQLLKKIDKKVFKNDEFIKMGGNQIENLQLKSIKDNSRFEINAVELLYSLPLNSFTLINDEKNDIYLAKIKNILYQDIESNKEKLEEYISKQNTNTKNSILKSYDLFLNEKYNVVLNQKTIERVKNFFK
jgi:peptidyl-prolyl cis-trans isomerase D